MRSKSILVLVIVCVMAVCKLEAAPVYYSGNSSYYELIDSQVTWWEANTATSSMSFDGRAGHLATITSAEENQFILDTFIPHLVPYGFWLGGNDIDVEGEWRWVTGPEAGTLFDLPPEN